MSGGFGIFDDRHGGVGGAEDINKEGMLATVDLSGLSVDLALFRIATHLPI